MREKVTGSCLCGAITYEVTGPIIGVVICHCSMCRKVGFSANAGVARERFRFLTATTLRSYASSPGIDRYFCGACGSPILWDPRRRDYVAFSAGTLEQPTGLTTIAHIYVDDCADYERPYVERAHRNSHPGPMYEQEN